jgi:glycosyltransferase involved in cell wall biosynthesis
VIIPTKDRPENLNRLLSSLENLILPSPTEVIVIDGCSSKYSCTRSILRSWLNKNYAFVAGMIREQEAQGPGRARNLGIDAALGEILAFTDDDCVVHPSWLYNLTFRIRSDCGLVGIGVQFIHYVRTSFPNISNFIEFMNPQTQSYFLLARIAVIESISS